MVAARLFPARVVDELAASRSCDPSGRIAWDAIGSPAYDGGGKSILHRLLREVEGARDTNEAGDNAPGLGTEN